MKIISLTQGKKSIVDDIDYDFLMQWKWCYKLCDSGIEYAFRRAHVGEVEINRSSYVPMHRAVLSRKLNKDIVSPYVVDHKYGDGLNNRRYNLRETLQKFNSRNRTKSKGKKSKYKGVSLHKMSRKWCAYIKVDYKMIWLGLHATEKKAALVYNKAAILYFGKYAKINMLDASTASPTGEQG